MRRKLYSIEMEKGRCRSQRKNDDVLSATLIGASYPLTMLIHFLHTEWPMLFPLDLIADSLHFRAARLLGLGLLYVVALVSICCNFFLHTSVETSSYSSAEITRLCIFCRRYCVYI